MKNCEIAIAYRKRLARFLGLVCSSLTRGQGNKFFMQVSIKNNFVENYIDAI
jgi:hypothetical protein